MEANVRTECLENDVPYRDSTTVGAEESCGINETECVQKVSSVIERKHANSKISFGKVTSFNHTSGHSVSLKTRKRNPWHNYKSAKCQAACFSCRQVNDEEKRQAIIRKGKLRRKTDLFKRLVNSVQKEQCRIICRDVIKDLVRNEAVVKIERVKFQQKTNLKHGTTLVQKVPPRNSVMRMKRLRKRKNSEISQKSKAHDELLQASCLPDCIDNADKSNGCDSPPCDDDHWLRCMQCNSLYHGNCPIHGPAFHIPNKDVYDKLKTTKARASLPDCLYLKESSIPEAGMGVFANIAITNGVCFGPYAGDILVDDVIESSYQWEIISQKQISHCIDGEDENSACWLRFVNCARTETEQNLIAVQYRSQIYYYSYKTIYPGEELLVWYGNQFAESLGLVEEDQSKGTKNEFVRRICAKCCCVLLNGKELVKHEKNGCIMRDKCKTCVGHLMDSTCLNLHAELISKYESCDGNSKLTNLPHPQYSCHAENYSEILTDENVLESRLGDDQRVRGSFCSSCSLKLIGVNSPQDHTRILHQNFDLWKCPKCDRRLVLNANFLDLLQQPDGNEAIGRARVKSVNQQQTIFRYPFACVRCRRAFVHQIEAMDHVANSCKFKRQTSSCSITKKFASVQHYLCDFPFCGAQYAKPAMRSKHFHRRHIKHGKLKKLSMCDIRKLYSKRPQVCNVCDAEIFSDKLFQTHMRVVHGILNNPSFPNRRTQREKNKCKVCTFNIEDRKDRQYTYRSYYAPLGDSKNYLLGTKGDSSMTEHSPSNVANESLLGELQDICVSSSEVYLKDKIFTGISEFCLHGQLPKDDIDFQRTTLSPDNDNPLVGCNEDPLDYNGNLVIDEKDPTAISSDNEKEEKIEINVFNKLFSDLLKDDFLLDACAEEQEPVTDVGSSSCHRSTNTPFIKVQNILVDRSSEEHQLPYIFKSQLGSSMITEKQPSSVNDFVDLPPSSQVKPNVSIGSFSYESFLAEEQSLETEVTQASRKADIFLQDLNPLVISHTNQVDTTTAEKRESQVCKNSTRLDSTHDKRNSHATTVYSSVNTHVSPSFIVISSDTNTDVDGHLTLPDLEDEEIPTACSPANSFDDGTSDLEKMLDCPLTNLAPSPDVEKVTTLSKDIAKDDLPSMANISGLKIAAASEISLERKTPLNHQSDGIDDTKYSHTNASIHCNSDFSITPGDEISECFQTFSTGASNFPDFDSKIRNTCHREVNPHHELDRYSGKEVSTLDLEHFEHSNRTESDTDMRTAGCKLSCTFNSPYSKSNRFDKLIPEEIYHNKDSRDISMEIVYGQRDHSYTVLKPEDGIGMDQSKVHSSQKDKSQLSHQEGYPVGQRPLIGCENGNYPILNPINNVDYADYYNEDVYDDITPELENDIIMAIQRYMAKGSKFCGKNLNLLKDRNSTAENLSSSSTDIVNDEFYRKNRGFKPLSLDGKTIFQSPAEARDDVSYGLLYKNLMNQRSCDSAVSNHKQPPLVSGLFAIRNEESCIRLTNGECTIGRPKQYLSENVSDLSSDEIRMQLKQAIGFVVLSDKINEFPTQKSNHNRTIEKGATHGPARNVPSITSTQLDSPSEFDGKHKAILSSQGKSPTEYSTWIQTGVACSLASLVKHPASIEKICAPHKSTANGNIHTEKNTLEWRSLLTECGESSTVDSGKSSSLSFLADRPLTGKTKERQKMPRNSVTSFNTVQPSFEFHKLTELTSKKKSENPIPDVKSSNSSALIGSRTENPNSLHSDESRGYPSIMRSSELLENIDYKRKEITANVLAKKNVKRRRTSSVSFFPSPSRKQSVWNAVNNLVVSDVLVANTENVQAIETSNLRSDCTSNGKNIKPRFMRSRSYDVNLEKRLQQSLLNAEKCVVELPDKYRVLGSTALTTICSGTFHNLLIPDHCSDLESTAGTESALCDSDCNSSSDTEMEELDMKILEKQNEMSKLMSEIRNIKNKIAHRSKSDLKQTCVLPEIKRRRGLKRLSFKRTDDTGLPTKRFRDTNENNGIDLQMEDMSTHQKVKNKRLVVRLGMIGSQKRPQEWVDRTWYCNDCAKSYKIRPCAVSLYCC